MHCHNDLGMAVANSWPVFAPAAGRSSAVNGIGERAGNAALEEVVMAIKTRGDILPYQVGIDARMLNRASKLVAAATSFPVQYNKAIVGRNAFAHESGIHQDGMLKHTQTYEIMMPESVGVSKTSLVMGKHSGRAAFRAKLKELGYDLGDNALEDAFNRFKALADRKSTSTTRTWRPWSTRDRHRPGPHEGGGFAGDCRHHGPAVGDAHPSTWATASGRRCSPPATVRSTPPSTPSSSWCAQGMLALYQVHAVTEGHGRAGRVSVRLEDGRAAAPSPPGPPTRTRWWRARSYLSALNKLFAKRGRLHAQQSA